MHKYRRIYPYTDEFRRNNAKCLRSNGICSFAPYSSIGGFSRFGEVRRTNRYLSVAFSVLKKVAGIHFRISFGSPS